MKKKVMGAVEAIAEGVAKVIFADGELAGRSTKHVRKAAIIKWAGAGGIFATAVGFCVLPVRSMRANQAVLATVNGAVDKSRNPHVPVSPDELCESIAACVATGASIVHVHADAPVVGGEAPHADDAYAAVFRAVLERSPQVLLYPTLPGRAPGP